MRKKTIFQPREIYGIAGKKGHGKDTFARLVCEAISAHKERKYRPFQIKHFADTIKQMSMRIFGITEKQVTDPATKDAPLSSPIVLDNYVEIMRAETGIAIGQHGLVARTPREVVQFFGTNYVRHIQDDYWVASFMSKMTKRTLVPDIRFMNEAEAIRKDGGHIVKIVRIDAKDTGDTHVSETEVDKIEPDLVIGTRTNNLSLPLVVANLVAIGRFESAMVYDYRMIQKAISAYTSGEGAVKAVALLKNSPRCPEILYRILDYYGIPLRTPYALRVPHKSIGGEECKWCSSCSSWLKKGSFNVTAKNWDGFAGICRACASVSNKRRYKLYDRINIDSLLRACKQSSTNRGIPFDLSKEQIKHLWDRRFGRDS